MKISEHIQQGKTRTLEIACVTGAAGTVGFVMGLIILVQSFSRMANTMTLAEVYNVPTGAIGACVFGIGMALLVFAGASYYFSRKSGITFTGEV